MKEYVQNSRNQHLPFFSRYGIWVDILRLDLIHPIISGNKWFKLKYYLEDARETNKSTLVSFGGVYSNHLVATAFAAKKEGLKSIGYVRGDKETKLSTTLVNAKNYGMQLFFIDRKKYRNKEGIQRENIQPNQYWIMEGGYGTLGAKGASEILKLTDINPYSHIICALGTGTMMAGLIKGSLPHQEVMGISVMKNNLDLENDVHLLLDKTEYEKKFSFIHDYHFGGYAKHPKQLIDFMKEIWLIEKLPTDIIYNSKMLFAVRDLLSKDYFKPGTKLLLIHSGGLQGNKSLPADCLPF